MSIEDHQRMVTGTPLFLGIVSYPSPLDCKTIQRKHCGIHVQDKACSGFGNRSQFVAQEVVDLHDSFEFFGMNAFQEVSQCSVGWETGQTQKPLEGTVVGQNSRVRDPLETCDHGVDQTHQEFRGMVGAVPALPGNIGLEKSFQTKLSTKLLKKSHATIVSKSGISEGKLNTSESFWHPAQSSPRGRFLQTMFCSFDYNILSSVNILAHQIKSWQFPCFSGSYIRNMKAKSDFGRENKSMIKNWLLNILLSGTFGGASDPLLEKARKVYLFKLKLEHLNSFNVSIIDTNLKKVFEQNNISLSNEATIIKLDGTRWGIRDGASMFIVESNDKQIQIYKGIIDNPFNKIFPAKEINEEFHKTPKITQVNREIIDKISYRSPESYLLLYLIYPYGINFTPSNNANYPEQDHIFSRKELEDSGYNQSEINRIGNLRLITSLSNKHKTDTPYTEWIKNESSDELGLSLIPGNHCEWNVKRYSEFVKRREEEILKKVQGEIKGHFADF